MACGSQGNTSQDDQAEAQQEQVAVNEPIVVALADFDAKAETLVGQEVILEGTVVHVCKHGGKKMFITAEDPEVRIKITPGEETESFDVELEGSYVKIHGVVEAMEAEVVDEGENTEAGEHVEDADHENYYHKPQYSVSCFEYTVKENIPEGE
ncbi:MAG TPA: OB-fold nucleic acid binding domain-containing protein [Bacteroidales bacterium]|nr:OB-fold nucleic acid binding domain-containing protein [Bacteroidales bacterium]